VHRIVSSIILALSVGSAAGQDSPSAKGSLRQLRFSPDGRYVLAQDDSEVAVLTVEPFTILFRIPAEKAAVAHFTPDSGQVVFVSSATRVDSQKILFEKSGAHVVRWDIADQTRLESTTLPLLVCGTEELSPDGRVLACVDLESTLRLIEVASGQTMFEKKRIARLFANYDPDSGLPSSYWGELGSAHIDFSPDGRFVVVRPRNAEGSPLAWNVRERSSVDLTGRLRQLKSGDTSAFISPDRMVVWNGASKKDLTRGVANVKVLAFPSGKLLSEPKIPYGLFLFRATDPGFVIVRPFGGRTIVIRNGDGFFMGQSSSNRAAAAELSTGLVIISDTPALDVYGRFYVAEPAKGEVGLYEIGKGLKAAVVLHQK
jgi:hypothetical protein